MTKITGFDVDVSAYDKAIAGFDAFDPIAAKEVETAIERIGALVKANVIVRLRRHTHRLGASSPLRKGVFYNKQGSGFATQARVRSSGPIAHLIAGGVKRHVIPKRGHELRRPMPIRRSGHIVAFAESVRHPGFPADPYFDKALTSSKTGIAGILKHSTDRLAQRLADLAAGGH